MKKGLPEDVVSAKKKYKRPAPHYRYPTSVYYSDVSMKMAIKLMGHSGAKMIMEVYAHLDEAKEMAPEKLEAFFKTLADNNNNETS